MIKNVIFDFGGVIITLDHQQAVRRFEELGVKDAVKRLDPYEQQGIFGDLERGNIDDETFRRELSILTGHEQTFDDCLYGWLGYVGELPIRNLRLLQQLRREGRRVILLSNTNPLMMSWAMSPEFSHTATGEGAEALKAEEGHPLSYYFDACYVSYQMKMMKPDERIFRRILESEHILANETLFVDDGPRNVAVASELGIHTFCPENGSDWTQEIYQHL